MFKKYALIYQCVALAVMLSTQAETPTPLFSQPALATFKKNFSFAHHVKKAVKTNYFSILEKFLKPFRSLSHASYRIDFKNILLEATKIKSSYTQGLYPVTDFVHNFFQAQKSNAKRTAYLVDAKNIYKEYNGNNMGSTIEQLKLCALNEYAKCKTPAYQELSLVDLDKVTDKQALNNIPYCDSTIENLSPSLEDGAGGSHRQKFLLHKGVPVGWIVYNYEKDKDGYIDSVGVVTTQRKSGYGSYLMTYALYEMEIAGVRKVKLRPADDSAIAFHETLGFHRYGNRNMKKYI